jgi:hypothetical protein
MADIALVIDGAIDGIAIQRNRNGFEKIQRAAAPEKLSIENLLKVVYRVRRRHTVKKPLKNPSDAGFRRLYDCPGPQSWYPTPNGQRSTYSIWPKALVLFRNTALIIT